MKGDLEMGLPFIPVPVRCDVCGKPFTALQLQVSIDPNLIVHEDCALYVQRLDAQIKTLLIEHTC